MSLPNKLEQDSHFRVLKLLEENPNITQRELADRLGISLGKSNYMLRALIEKGHVKIAALRKGGNKLKRVAYLLTPEGFESRLSMTRKYLDRKRREYEALKAEIDALSREAEGARPRLVSDPQMPFDIDR
jgi:EPS-associated MarR family transcriptional regulator